MSWPRCSTAIRTIPRIMAWESLTSRGTGHLEQQDWRRPCPGHLRLLVDTIHRHANAPVTCRVRLNRGPTIAGRTGSRLLFAPLVRPHARQRLPRCTDAASVTSKYRPMADPSSSASSTRAPIRTRCDDTRISAPRDTPGPGVVTVPFERQTAIRTLQPPRPSLRSLPPQHLPRYHRRRNPLPSRPRPVAHVDNQQHLQLMTSSGHTNYLSVGESLHVQ